jgi:hypothetical protein
LLETSGVLSLWFRAVLSASRYIVPIDATHTFLDRLVSSKRPDDAVLLGGHHRDDPADCLVQAFKARLFRPAKARAWPRVVDRHPVATRKHVDTWRQDRTMTMGHACGKCGAAFDRRKPGRVETTA